MKGGGTGFGTESGSRGLLSRIMTSSYLLLFWAGPYASGIINGESPPSIRSPYRDISVPYRELLAAGGGGPSSALGGACGGSTVSKKISNFLYI